MESCIQSIQLCSREGGVEICLFDRLVIGREIQSISYVLYNKFKMKETDESLSRLRNTLSLSDHRIIFKTLSECCGTPKVYWGRLGLIFYLKTNPQPRDRDSMTVYQLKHENV